jgi:hypothetical protein
MSETVAPTPPTQKLQDPRVYSQVLRGWKRNNRVMSSFMVQPEGVSVEIQEANEQLLLLVREHFITNTPWILFSLFLLILPIVFTQMPMWQLLPGRFQFIGLWMWLLFILTVVLEGFLSWYFDVFVVTDKRVIDIDFHNLIYKNITSANIEHIQDVTYNVAGPLASFLDYGMVMVQTASEIPMMEIPNTPHPALVAKLVGELMLQSDQEHH